MKINAINKQNFEAKKFRLPVKFVKPTSELVTTNQVVARDSFVSGNFVREYSNPDAEKFFNKALNTSDFDEKMRYLEQMGDYKIIDISLEQQKDSFIKAADKMP